MAEMFHDYSNIDIAHLYIICPGTEVRIHIMDWRILDTIDSVCCYEELYETDRYILALQETYSDSIGFDWTICSRVDGREIDGGIYEDSTLDRKRYLEYMAREFLDCRAEDIILIYREG